MAKVRHPFHETIVKTIKYEVLSRQELLLLGRLIKETKIPENHDAIIAAWKGACKKFNCNSPNFIWVINNLLEQKKEAEAEEKAKTRKPGFWSEPG